MNIAFFSKDLPSDRPNGVSVQVDRLADALVGRGHRVTCFSFSPRPDTARYDHVRLQRGNGSQVFQKFVPAMEFRKINTGAFDLCHYHGDDYLCSGQAARVRTFYGSALFEALHATSRPGRFFYQLLFYKLEWISCLRKGTLAGISSLTRKALPLVRHVVPCGIPVDTFTPDFSMKTKHPSLLFIGDFKSRKQGTLLLRVFIGSILPRFPEAVLTVVGPEAVTAKNVRYLGRIKESDLINEYRKAWVYCMASSYEGFGVPAIEAFGCGTAVVAVDSSGTRELLQSGSSGILCGPEDLGDSIRKVFENTGLRDTLVKNGLEKVKQYDMRMIAERYEALYNKAILSGKKK